MGSVGGVHFLWGKLMRDLVAFFFAGARLSFSGIGLGLWLLFGTGGLRVRPKLGRLFQNSAQTQASLMLIIALRAPVQNPNPNPIPNPNPNPTPGPILNQYPKPGMVLGPGPTRRRQGCCDRATPKPWGWK